MESSRFYLVLFHYLLCSVTTDTYRITFASKLYAVLKSVSSSSVTVRRRRVCVRVGEREINALPSSKSAS